MLTPQFKKTLKAKAHSLKPIVMIGAKGLTENVLSEIHLGLDAHELIKVKLSGADREERKMLIQEILQQTDAELVQSLGMVATIYREKPADE